MTSLQTRLAVVVSLLAVVAVAAVALSARHGTRREFLKFREEVARLAPDAGRSDPESLARSLDGACCAPAHLDAVARTLKPRELLVILDDRTGERVALEPAGRLQNVRLVRDGDLLSLDAAHPSGNIVEQLSVRLKGRGAAMRLSDGRQARVYVLPLPAPDAPAEAFLRALDLRLVFATALVGMLAVGATWLLARRTVRPLRELQAATDALARGDLRRRVDTKGGDEIARLSHSFNALATELQRQQELRRSLLSDVTHELRTPVTALRCRLESMLDGMDGDLTSALRGANEDVMHLGQLVEDLQDVALAEARELRLDVADVALGSLVVSATRSAGLERDPRLRADIATGLHVRADAVRTRQVLTNLLSNAARYTPPDGCITVRGRQDAGRVLVDVHNTGSELTDEQLARVFDRFYRTDESRQRATGGTGLGLAIVKNLVEAQGGRVWARRESAGMTFGFSLYAAAVIRVSQELDQRRLGAAQPPATLDHAPRW